MNLHKPPCWREGQPCPNECAAGQYRRIVWNVTPLHGLWEGWRLAGARLVSPHGEWIDARSLDRLLHARARFR